MASPSELAEAFFIVVKRMLKWVTISVAVVAVLGGLIWAGNGVYDNLTYERHKRKIESIIKPTDRCTVHFPVAVGWINKSDKTVLSVTFYLHASYPNHSTNLASYTSYTMDRILKPGEGWSQCWKPELKYGTDKSTDLTKLEWSVDSFRVNFAE